MYVLKKVSLFFIVQSLPHVCLSLLNLASERISKCRFILLLVKYIKEQMLFDDC
jgi:hypothetical protein